LQAKSSGNDGLTGSARNVDVLVLTADAAGDRMD
jgi:hypothetical protein